ETLHVVERPATEPREGPKASEVAAGSLFLRRLAGNRSIGMQQLGVPQIRPQCCRDRVAQQTEVCPELLGIPRARNDRGNPRVSEWELKRRSGQRHSVTVANCGDRGYPLDHLGRGRPIVPGLATSKDAGIEWSANNDRGAGSNTFGQEIVE